LWPSALRFLVAFSQGRTEAEAVENIREAIAACLEARAANYMPLTIAVREVEVHV